MMVLHGFNEDSQVARDEHLEFWFGNVRGDAGPLEVCFCGAHLEALKYADGEITVAAVWHVGRYPFAYGEDDL